jgi:hypothetical protein
MNQLERQHSGLDALRIRAEIETADRSQNKRTTWAPAVVLEGELLALCHELEYLAPGEKPVARLWAIFADPKRKGAAIRTTFSKHPLLGISCRGFELRAGTAHDGNRMANALMDSDGTWSVSTINWRHSSIRKMRYWVSEYESRCGSYQRALEPAPAPIPITTPEQAYEWAIQKGESEEQARFRMENTRSQNARMLAKWEEREQKKRDPNYIEQIRVEEERTLELLAKLRRKIAREEASPDWRYKALTRMFGDRSATAAGVCRRS